MEIFFGGEDAGLVLEDVEQVLRCALCVEQVELGEEPALQGNGAGFALGAEGWGVFALLDAVVDGCNLGFFLFKVSAGVLQVIDRGDKSVLQIGTSQQPGESSQIVAFAVLLHDEHTEHFAAVFCPEQFTASWLYVFCGGHAQGVRLVAEGVGELSGRRYALSSVWQWVQEGVHVI